MSSKVALLAVALVLSAPVFADKPPKSTQTITKAPASKNASNKTPKTSPNLGGTANSGVINETMTMMQKDAKANNASQRKEAQAAAGSTRGAHKVPGSLTSIPPKK
jgi:hypothetical protein